MTRFKLPLISLAGALALAACGEATPDTAATTTTDAATAPVVDTSAPDARTFLADAMMGDNAEVRAGNLAAEKGVSEGVKEYGECWSASMGRTRPRS